MQAGIGTSLESMMFPGQPNPSDFFLKDNPVQFRLSGGVNPCNLFILTSELFVSKVACAFRIWLGFNPYSYLLLE